MSDDKPKIIVDSDWKEQAAREKEELAEKAKPAEKQPERKPDFITHSASLATQAMIFMGAIAHPMTGQAEVDFSQARFAIDSLEMLKVKTEGNLNEEEARTLDSLISELKMVWVQAEKHYGGAPPAANPDADAQTEEGKEG